jgi:hypothetical protein
MKKKKNINKTNSKASSNDPKKMLTLLKPKKKSAISFTLQIIDKKDWSIKTKN